MDEAIVDELCSQFMADNAGHFILPADHVRGEKEGIMQILWSKEMSQSATALIGRWNA